MSILNLLVVCATLIAVNQFEPLSNGAFALMRVSPLWDSSGNDSDYCSLYTDETSTAITFVGNPMHMCSIRVSTNLTASVRIPANLTADYSLFVDDFEGEDDCLDKVAAIYGNYKQDGHCSTLLRRNARLNLQGNVSIIISELSAQQFETSKCTLYGDNDFNIPAVNGTLANCKVMIYDRITSCVDPNSPICRLSLPSHCYSVLLYSEVSLTCVIENHVYHENDLVIFPSFVTMVNLTWNNVAQIGVGTFENLKQLETLRLGYNDIHWLYPGVFLGLGNLLELYLEHNHLVTLESQLFNDLQSLKVLDISSNELKVLPISVFWSLTHVQEIILSGNRFKTVDFFKGLSNLQKLDLSVNQITTLQADVFEDLISLKRLYLSENSLVNVNANLFRNLTNLSVLYLQNNKLRNLDRTTFWGLTKLFVLKLNGNQITSFDSKLFQDLTSVFLLYLHDNMLEYIHSDIFEKLKNIHSINLSKNKLSVLPHDLFEGLPHLDVINLGHNYIESLPMDIFKGIVELQTLYLDNNNLEYLEKEIFADSRNLYNFVLSGNNMSRIDLDIFNNTPKLATLDLSQNSLAKVPYLGGLENLYFVNLNENNLLEVTKHSFVGMSSELHMFVSQHEVCDCYVPVGVNCSASSYRSPFLTCNRLLSDRVLVAMMWLIGLNALIGNGFVLYYNDKYNKNRIQTFLCKNLAMSDLIMGVYMLVIAIADIYYGDGFPMRAERWRTSIICRITGALSIISSESSVFFVTLISVDRFLGVIFPHSDFKFGKISIKVTVALIWIFAIVIGTLPSSLAGWNPSFYDNSHVCIGLPLALYGTFTKTTATATAGSHGMYRIEVPRWLPTGDQIGMYYSTAVFLGLNCVCYLVVAVCYICIIVTVYLSSKRVGTINASMKTQIRLTLKVAAIVITDFMCWCPVIVLGILVQTRVLTLPPSVFAWMVTFVLPINSAINPYLYTIADAVNRWRSEAKTTSKLSISGADGKKKNNLTGTLSTTYEDKDTEMETRSKQMNNNK